MHDAHASRAGETSVPLAASAVLVNKIGLHARPSVKLTQCAKGFAAKIELALAADGPWTDAKSPGEGDAREGAAGRDAAFPRYRPRR